jgi:iron complex outermembrane receptor protein
MGVSSCSTTDARLRWRLAKNAVAAVGIDNLDNARYWNFHNGPQRSLHAELKLDL